MATTTIRVSSEARDQLNQLARRRGAPAGEVVADLIQEADERTMLADAEDGWERLTADPEALAVYRSEAEELDGFESPIPEY